MINPKFAKPKTRKYRFVPRQLALSFFQDLSLDFVFNLGPNLEHDIFYQLTTVLRCREGDIVEFILPENWQGNAQAKLLVFEIKATAKKNLELLLIQIITPPKSSSNFQVAFSLPKNNDKLTFLIQKATELGARRIIMLQTAFSNYPHQPRLDRLQEIILEALEQSEGSYLPDLILEPDFAKLLQAEKENLLIALERSADQNNSLLALENLQGRCLVLGPEGGFSPTEKELIESLSISSFHLSDQVLRQETALILACGITLLRLS